MLSQNKIHFLSLIRTKKYPKKSLKNTNLDLVFILSYHKQIKSQIFKYLNLIVKMIQY